MTKTKLHPRNRHRGRYDFKALTATLPALSAYVATNKHGDESIDFANPSAVKTLNQALLKYFYLVSDWSIPDGYLCPPVPGRADYIHHLADLLLDDSQKQHPTRVVRVLDIGVGANCIYPLIGQHEYGWQFVGSDNEITALEAASRILKNNPGLEKSIELRLQKSSKHFFKGVIKPTEYFNLSLCNPPFHSSLAEAHECTHRKWNNLGRAQTSATPILLNFGGKESELSYPGGEREFITSMIHESELFSKQCGWFSSLVSKEANLPLFIKVLQDFKNLSYKIINMSQGQKISRVLAWKF